MALTHPTAIRDLLATVIKDAVDASGGGTAHIDIATDATFASILVTLPITIPFFGTPSSGVLTATTIAAANASASGTAAAFRIVNRNGDTVYSGTVTNSGGGGDMLATSTSLIATEPFQITSLTYTAPN